MARVIACAFALICGLASSGRTGELCIAPSETNGYNVSVSCIDLLLYENDWSGFRSGGASHVTRSYVTCA